VSKTIEDLREHLFATLAALRDKEKPMEIARAKAVAEVAQTIINSAKAEVDYLRVTRTGRSTFIKLEHDGDDAIEHRPGDGKGIKGVIRHRLK
jgi:hypothetical protein